MGKLIVIEGSDGSGKATQSMKLYEELKNNGQKVMKVEYPNYNSESSALVKMYLSGKFGSRPGDVNPFASSTFFAVDRFASYKTVWGDFYNQGGIIIADRYTTSNMVHQAAKISNEVERDKFLDWLWDLEFDKIGLPVPDMVIFLDMPPEFSFKLIKNRDNKITGESEKDIHEKDLSYLQNSYKNSCYLAEKYNWIKINCVDGERILTIDEIHKKIHEKVDSLLNII